MSNLLKVISLKSKGKLIKVFISNRQELLLDPEICNRYNLVRGVEITAALLNRIESESEWNQAERYASYLLARQEYSCGLLKMKLLSKGYGLKLSTNVMSRLKKSGHVDDDRYARRKVESILKNKPAGRRYLVAYLKSKYIPGNLAERTVSEILCGYNEDDMALKLLKDRWWYFSKFGIDTARRKAYNYLSRRSISYQAARSAFERISKEEF